MHAAFLPVYLPLNLCSEEAMPSQNPHPSHLLWAVPTAWEEGGGSGRGGIYLLCPRPLCLLEDHASTTSPGCSFSSSPEGGGHIFCGKEEVLLLPRWEVQGPVLNSGALSTPFLVAEGGGDILQTVTYAITHISLHATLVLYALSCSVPWRGGRSAS